MLRLLVINKESSGKRFITNFKNMALVADTMGPMATVEADLISIHTNTKY